VTLHKYTWRPFRKSDLDTLELLEEREIVLKHADDLHVMGESLTDDQFCGIACWNGEPILIGGWKEVIAGVYRVFIIPTKNIFNHPVNFTRIVIRWRRKIERFPGCWKIITVSLPLERIDQWMKTVGFVYERKLEQYTNGQDYSLWSRTWDTAALINLRTN